MPAYYNEWEPYAATWLRSLIAAGHIAPGDVDERSIADVQPDDLRGYEQCHFFAGIGGWSHALRLAGWADTRPVWTGSCPCQPFSTAGKRAAQQDERHLWPVWFRLIRECRPASIFGEQVAAAVTQGWLDDVATDLEAEGYAIGAAVLPACAAGAFHRRDRLWFLANAEHYGLAARAHGAADAKDGHARRAQEQIDALKSSGSGASELMADADRTRQSQSQGHEQELGGRPFHHGEGCNVAGFADESDDEWIECPDGKHRAVKSGIRLLAHGVPCRVGRLRAYGNAIDPRIAAEFIRGCEGIT